MARFKHIFA